MYQHLNIQGQPVPLPVTRVLCIGRNYLDHIQELNNTVPDEALLFMKPAPALCHLSEPVVIPSDKGECHNELEVAILLSQSLCKATPDDALAAVWGAGLALDLTLRDVQSELKAQGYPWERAKAFDRSCPVSAFAPLTQTGDLTDIHFTLTVNDTVRQQGHTAMMIRPVAELIAEMSHIFTLQPGDIILTGTPKGVGPLNAGDRIRAELGELMSVETNVVM